MGTIPIFIRDWGILTNSNEKISFLPYTGSQIFVNKVNPEESVSLTINAQYFIQILKMHKKLLSGKRITIYVHSSVDNMYTTETEQTCEELESAFIRQLNMIRNYGK